MAIVITNGTYYIATNKNGRVVKTSILEDAQHFYNVNVASRKIQKTPGKCKGYYVFDTEGNDKTTDGKRNQKKKRRKYSEDTRKLIYNKAEGKCALCGREIAYEEMTLDHIIPLAMNGKDCVDNLDCTCKSCNQFKGSVLPDDFFYRITAIFLYQMGKKYNDRLEWKIVHKMLKRMI